VKRSCSWGLAPAPACALSLPALRIPEARKVGSSGQAKPEEEAFVDSEKLLFLSFYQNHASGK